MAPNFFRRRSVATASAEKPSRQRIQGATVEEEQSQDKATPSWPPPMSQASIDHLINAVTDWQLLHGSIVKQPVLRAFVSQRLAVSSPMTVSLVPTPFPRRLFEKALNMQTIWNELYAKVSCDRTWLEEVTRELRRVDPFSRVLWEIVEEAEKRRQGLPGLDESPHKANVLEMATWRSDYMIHQDKIPPSSESGERLCLKQVEFSTLGCTGGVRSKGVSDMHQYLTSTGLYRQLVDPDKGKESPRIEPERLPLNDGSSKIVTMLSTAYQTYNEQCRVSSKDAGMGMKEPAPRSLQTCVLIVVQPFSSNIADQRVVEYGLWSVKPRMPCFQVSFGQEVQERTRLLGDGRLLFAPPGPSKESFEVAVVFNCAGHKEDEYLDVDSRDWATGKARLASTQAAPSIRSRGAQCRIVLEASNAIKCPPMSSHIAAHRGAQMALAAEGALARFFPDETEKQQIIRDTRIEMLSATEEAASVILADTTRAKSFDLKPGIPGAGGGISGADIVEVAQRMSSDVLARQVLCKKPTPPPMQGALMSSRGLYQGAVACELQVFGSCIWRRKPTSAIEIHASEACGWALKTMSVNNSQKANVNAYDAFDSPMLVDDNEVELLFGSKPPASSSTDYETPRSFSTAF